MGTMGRAWSFLLSIIFRGNIPGYREVSRAMGYRKMLLLFVVLVVGVHFLNLVIGEVIASVTPAERQVSGGGLVGRTIWNAVALAVPVGWFLLFQMRRHTDSVSQIIHWQCLGAEDVYHIAAAQAWGAALLIFPATLIANVGAFLAKGYSVHLYLLRSLFPNGIGADENIARLDLHEATLRTLIIDTFQAHPLLPIVDIIHLVVNFLIPATVFLVVVLILLGTRPLHETLLRLVAVGVAVVAFQWGVQILSSAIESPTPDASDGSAMRSAGALAIRLILCLGTTLGVYFIRERDYRTGSLLRTA